MNIVLDTNCLIMSISKASPYHEVWTGLLEGRYTICYTTDILLEYEEVLTRKTNAEFAKAILSVIVDQKNAIQVKKYYRLGLITADPDDNKFADCAFAANARYIVSNDHHYDALRRIDFPKIDVVDIEEFVAMLRSR